MTALDLDPVIASSPTVSARADRVLMPGYGTERPAFVRGHRCELVDATGRTYLDLLSGIGACALGHAHPALARAVATQARTLVHCSNLYVTEPAVALAEWLTARTFADHAFFCNSGTEAVEAAIKLARRSASARGEAYRHEIVSFSGSFHGRTFGAMSATGQASIQRGYAPLAGGFVHLPFGDADALDAAISPETAAVILEPIQGEGGVRAFDAAFLQRVRERCDDHGALLIHDEIQCGMGRTGTLLAADAMGVTPDIVCLAKALGGGAPIGAMLARAEVTEGLAPSWHGSTFGGNPLACSAALAVCRTIEDEQLIARCGRLGTIFAAQLEALCAATPRALDVRGRGLMQGVRIDGCPREVAARMRDDHGVLCAAAGSDVVRFLPPYIVTEDDLQRGVAALHAVLMTL